MTTATTILALLPVVTSTGRGADIMLPMALPALGGMTLELVTLFVVPVLYCAVEEARARWTVRRGAGGDGERDRGGPAQLDLFDDAAGAPPFSSTGRASGSR
jgi:hypothetical protein